MTRFFIIILNKLGYCFNTIRSPFIHCASEQNLLRVYAPEKPCTSASNTMHAFWLVLLHKTHIPYSNFYHRHNKCNKQTKNKPCAWVLTYVNTAIVNKIVYSYKIVHCLYNKYNLFDHRLHTLYTANILADPWWWRACLCVSDCQFSTNNKQPL